MHSPLLSSHLYLKITFSSINGHFQVETTDNLCKLVTDQWRGSLGVRDSCWFTEEIGTYMRRWESPGDLPRVIEIFVSFREWKIPRSFPRTYVRTYYSCPVLENFIWIKPLLRGHLSYKAIFSLSQRWPLNTDLIVYILLICWLRNYGFLSLFCFDNDKVNWIL